jgi:hypothetical protein
VTLSEIIVVVEAIDPQLSRSGAYCNDDIRYNHSNIATTTAPTTPASSAMKEATNHRIYATKMGLKSNIYGSIDRFKLSIHHHRAAKARTVQFPKDVRGVVVIAFCTLMFAQMPIRLVTALERYQRKTTMSFVTSNWNAEGVETKIIGLALAVADSVIADDASFSSSSSSSSTIDMDDLVERWEDQRCITVTNNSCSLPCCVFVPSLTS